MCHDPLLCYTYIPLEDFPYPMIGIVLLACIAFYSGVSHLNKFPERALFITLVHV